MLSSLDVKKANGWDGIAAKINCKKYCTYGITLLFTTGQIPKAWKVSSVVPIPKSSEVTSVSNFRPKSLLSVVSKLLEKHLSPVISPCQTTLLGRQGSPLEFYIGNSTGGQVL